MSPIQHAKGLRGLDGQPIPSGPPPLPPTRGEYPSDADRLALAEAAQRYQRPASETYPDVPAYTITVDERDTGVSIIAQGASMDEAIQDAMQKYEAAQPIQRLVWADGSTVDGLAHALLVDALGMLEISLESQGQGHAPLLMLGRLKAALGQTD